MAEIVHKFVADPDEMVDALEAIQKEIVKTNKLVEQTGKKSDDNLGKKGTKSAKAMKTAMDGVAIAATAVAAAVGIAAAAVFELADAANEYAKQAKKFGSTAEEYQIVSKSLEMLVEDGVNVSDALSKMQKSAADNSQAFQDLGIDADKFIKLPLRDQVSQVAEAIGNLDTEAEQTQAAMAILSESGAKLVPAFQDGGAAIEDAMAQVEDAGVISNAFAAQAEALEDEMGLLKITVTSLGSQALAPLLPILTGTSKAMRQAATETEGFTDSSSDLVDMYADYVVPAVATFNSILEQLGIAIATSIRVMGLGTEATFGWGKALKNGVGPIEFFTKTNKAMREEIQFGKDSLQASREENAKWAYSVQSSVRTAEQVGPTLDSASDAIDDFGESNVEASEDVDRLRLAMEKLQDDAQSFVDSNIESAIKIAESFMSADDQIISSADRKVSALLEREAELILSNQLSADEQVAVAESTAVAIVAIEADKDAQLAELRQARIDEEVEAAQAARVARTEAAAEAVQAEQEALDYSIEITEAYAEVIASIFDTISEAKQAEMKAALEEEEELADEIEEINELLAGAMSNSERARLEDKKAVLQEEQALVKEEALAAFEANKASSVASAIIATALAVITGLTAQPWPVGIALAAAAGITGAASIATIDQQPAPSFHSGGMITSDEVSIVAREGEAVLSPQAVSDLGGEQGVNDLNRGHGSAGQVNVTVFKVENKAVDAMVTNNLRTRRGPLSESLRAVQPTKVKVTGHNIPAAFQ